MSFQFQMTPVLASVVGIQWIVVSAPHPGVFVSNHHLSPMDGAKSRLLPSHVHFATPQIAKRNKRFWIFALLAGMFLVGVGFRGVLRGPGRKPHTGCGKGHLHPNPNRSHYTLSSGDKIPSVALGGFGPLSFSAYRLTAFSLFVCASGVWQAGRGQVGQAIKAALAAGYRHIDDAWIYGVRNLIFLGRINQPTNTHTE